MSAAATAGAAESTDGAATRDQRRRKKSRSAILMTRRGVSLLATGLLIAALGIGFATPILVYVGIAMGVAVAVGWLWVLLAVKSFSRSRASAHRQVNPHPLTAGVPGEVSVTISTGGRGAWLHQSATQHMDLREQAAAELTGGAGTKAAVERGQGTLTLRYGLHPTARGRWPLGPAIVHSSDPLGTVVADTSVGTAQQIPVWPAIVDLSGPTGALMGQAARVVLGARTPSADDSSLRDYREGDDLRRVHWPSSARLGTMLVRSDERAGRRPATVILDAPREPLALERAITVAASIAVSVVAAGHPVRLVGAGLDAEAMSHLGERGGDTARVELLNQTIDLHSPQSRAAATAALVRAARLVADDVRHGEVTVAVLEPLEDEALEELAPIGEAGRAWAIVRTDAHLGEQSQRTAAGLRKAGWRVVTTDGDDDVEKLWTRLLSAGDLG